jgi:hypothetical protein
MGTMGAAAAVGVAGVVAGGNQQAKKRVVDAVVAIKGKGQDTMVTRMMHQSRSGVEGDR